MVWSGGVLIGGDERGLTPTFDDFWNHPLGFVLRPEATTKDRIKKQKKSKNLEY